MGPASARRLKLCKDRRVSGKFMLVLSQKLCRLESQAIMSEQSNRNASVSEFFVYTAPFFAFAILFGLVPMVEKIAPQHGPIWLQHPEHLVYPLQTLICGGLLVWLWRKIDFRGIAAPAMVFAAGFFVFAIWTAPQFFYWLPPRYEGFNPDLFLDSPRVWWAAVILRFLRLVIVVPLLEEIFWRGFLMRWLIKEDFASVPFGTFRWKAFLLTALAFALAHWGNNWIPGPDFAAALITGIIYNAIACLTRSLGSCVFAHAVTNLFLGLYIMQTKQWGFW